MALYIVCTRTLRILQRHVHSFIVFGPSAFFPSTHYCNTPAALEKLQSDRCMIEATRLSTELPQQTSLLLLDALKSLQDEISQMRSTLETVDMTTSNNAQRLEAIDRKLDDQQELLSRPRDPPTNLPPTQPFSASALLSHRFMAASAVCALLLLSRRSRRLLYRGLHSVPFSMILLAQSSAGCCLLYRSACDQLELLTDRRGEPSASERALRERRRLIAYLVLVVSSACIPAKVGVALLARALQEPRGRRRSLACQHLK